MTENIAVFLTELRNRGVEIVPKEGRLRVDAPAGLLTGKDRERLAIHKNDILEYLRQKNDRGESVQPGDMITWVSPLFGPAGPAAVLARSGEWLFVDNPSHPQAVPIVNDHWQVGRVGRVMKGKG